MYGERIRQWDFAVKKIFRFSGQRLTVGADFYNMMNSNVTLAFNGDVRAEHAGLGLPDLST